MSMLYVSIETSSSRGSLALHRDGTCLDAVDFPDGLVHGREISVRLRDLLRGAGVRVGDLQAVVVSCGPGSYTGSRVGVTAAKTLGFALGLPVVPISSLEVIAAGALLQLSAGETVFVALDARRGFYFGAAFRSIGSGQLERISPDEVGEGDHFASRARSADAICGDGADKVLGELSQGELGEGDLSEGELRQGAGSMPRRLSPEGDLPRARSLGDFAASRVTSASYDAEAVHVLEPEYLRPSEPEIRLAQRQKSQRQENKSSH